MHIDFSICDEPLTAEQKSHIDQCEDCRLDYQNLTELERAGNQIQLELPDEDNWRNISNKLTTSKLTVMAEAKQRKSRPYIKHFLAMAASVSFVFIGWMGWSNYHLQSQLDQALLANQFLEEQLNNSQAITYKKAVLVESLRSLDSELYDAETVREKLILLEKRQQVINSYISNKQGRDYVFSI